jgi:hypothetical protein
MDDAMRVEVIERSKDLEGVRLHRRRLERMAAVRNQMREVCFHKLEREIGGDRGRAHVNEADDVDVADRLENRYFAEQSRRHAILFEFIEFEDFEGDGRSRCGVHRFVYSPVGALAKLDLALVSKRKRNDKRTLVLVLKLIVNSSKTGAQPKWRFVSAPECPFVRRKRCGARSCGDRLAAREWPPDWSQEQ